MNGYTITQWMLRALLVVVVCLCLTGCADLWMLTYRVKGGYYKRVSTSEDWHRKAAKQQSSKGRNPS
jgi:uncharacterized protein YceK